MGKMHLIVTDNSRKTIGRLMGYVRDFNKCRMTGTLLDGRSFRIINRHGLYRTNGMKFTTWNADCPLTKDEEDQLNVKATREPAPYGHDAD